MQKLSTFFRTVAFSSVSPLYYRDVLKAKFGFSMKYFLLFNLIAAVVTMVRIMVPVTMFDVNRFANEVIQIYPADLRISIENGRLSINQPLPYVLPIPDWMETWNNDTDLSEVDALVTFDSDENIQGIKDFLDSRSIITLTETTMYLREDLDTNEVKALPIPEDAEPFTLDAGAIQQVKQGILDQPFIKNRWYVGVLGALLLVFLYPAMLAWRFASVVWYSVLTFIVLAVFRNVLFQGQKFTFEKVIQVTIHSLTPVIILAYVFDVLGYPMVLTGWTYFFVYLVFTVVMLAMAVQNTSQTKKRK